MNNGDRFVGEITKYVQGEQVDILLKDGSTLSLKETDIKKIMQETGGAVEREEIESFKPEKKVWRKPQTKGIYNITQLSFALGEGDNNGLALGAGISSIIGRQFSPALGVGLGLGLDNYARRGETIYPVFLDLRTYLPFSKKPHAYYLALNGGYGFAFTREGIGINEAEGGYMGQVAIGYRSATQEGVDVNVDIGTKFQEARFSRDLFNGDVEVRDLVFQRIVVRIGITLWGKK